MQRNEDKNVEQFKYCSLCIILTDIDLLSFEHLSVLLFCFLPYKSLKIHIQRKLIENNNNKKKTSYFEQ